MGMDRVIGPLRLHHVGILVGDLDTAIARYQALGFPEPEIFDIADQGVRVASFDVARGYVEILAPTEPESGVVRYLESRGEGMHHVAYAVADLEAALRHLDAAGFELIDRVPRTGVHGWRIAFIHPRSCVGVLTELVETDSV
jgi:methylmalonyl-CoA/ethylmalonyl-CoA epimerase